MTDGRSEQDRVRIFDTTLRDGEQSPGIALNRAEKLEIAHQLARLGVDIIEAGFPITSPGDFDSVQAIAREVHGPVICGLARTSKQDIDAAWNADQGLRAAADPHLHRHERHPHRAQAPDHARGREGPGARRGGARPPVHRRRGVLARGRLALRRGVHGRGDPDRARRGRHHDQRARHGRLHDAPRVRGDVRPPLRARAGPARRDRLGPLPRRPGAGRGELVRRAHRGRPPGGVRDQRDRRARRQRLARGDRDAAPHARAERGPLDGREHARDRAHVAARVPADRLPGAAQQGDRRPQRLRPRGRHPPGRGPEGAHHLRDHGRHHDRARLERDRARQALRPPRPAQRARGAGLRG